MATRRPESGPWPDDGPWTLLHKPRRKYARWAVTVTAPTFREAAARIGNVPNADWWLTNRPEPRAAAPTPEE